MKCSSGPTKGDCISMLSSGVLQISPCLDGLECNTTSLYAQTSSWTTVSCTKAYAAPDLCEGYFNSIQTGRRCCVSSNCYNQQCTNDRCEGTDNGQSCKTDEECYPNYYCNGECAVNNTSGCGNGTCVPNVVTGCTRDNMCQVGFGCINSNCIQFHTQDYGFSTNRSIFCKTGFVYNGKCDSIEPCDANYNPLPLNMSCNLGSTCKYKLKYNGSVYDTGDCLCSGYLNDAYCGLYANRSSQVIPFYSALVYSSSYCSGAFGHTDDYEILLECGAITNKSYDYAKYMLNRFNYYNLYQSNALDHCARPLKLFNPWYNERAYLSRSLYLFISLVSLII